MEQISRIGMDTSKHFFQLHGVNAAEKVVLRKKLRRKEMVAFFKALAPTVIGIEACGAAHYLARLLLGSFGHEVKLIAPQLVKPYVKRGKNDGADAEALCEAMSRPSMRFAGEDCRASGPDDGRFARPTDPQLHAAIERHSRLCGRVRFLRRQGQSSLGSTARTYSSR